MLLFVCIACLLEGLLVLVLCWLCVGFLWDENAGLFVLDMLCELLALSLAVVCVCFFVQGVMMFVCCIVCYEDGQVV